MFEKKTNEGYSLLLFFSGSFLFFSFLLPNHYFPWLVAYQDFLAFLAAICVFAYFSFSGAVVVAPGLFFFLLVVLIPLWQFSSGIVYFFGDALVASLYLFCFALMLLLGYNVGVRAATNRFVCTFFSMLILAAIFSVWIALLQWLMLSGSIWVVDMPPGGRPFANFAQPNNLATLLCMAIAAAWYFYERRLLGSFSSSILVLFLMLGVVLTQSRTPWVGCIAVAIFWLWKARCYSARLPNYALLMWLGIYVGLVISFPWFADALHLSVGSLLDRAQALHRWQLWVQLWAAVWEGPIGGYGWNQVSVAQVAISQIYPVPLMVEHSHNILLDLLIWNGPLLGGLIICAVAVWLIRLGMRARSVESVFCLLVVGFVLTHAMLEFPLEYGFFLFPVGLLLGIVAGEQRSPREWVVPRSMVGAVLALSLCIFAWVWHEYRVIEEDHRLMRFETARIGDLKAEQDSPDVVLLTQLGEFIRFARTPATEEMSAEQLEWMRKVVHRYPYPPSLFRYSLALALNGQAIQSSEQLTILRALHGDKHFDESMQALVQMQVKKPQLQDVLQLLEQ